MSLLDIILGHKKLIVVMVLFFFATFGFGAFISLSIPFNTISYPKHIAEIQFNEEMFSGSVNEFSVHNLIALRLGIWAGSIDAENTNMDMPGRYGYKVDITEHHSTRNIVGDNGLTFLLICNVAIFVSTLFTCCHACPRFPKFCLTYWVVEGMVVFTSLITLLVNEILVSSVSTEMQKLGETIVTKSGPVPYYIGLINLLALVVALLSRHLVKEIAKPAKPKDDGGGPKTYRLALNPPAPQQAQSVPPPLTPFQRVQALMPPRNAPAAPQQTQGSVAPRSLGPRTRTRRQQVAPTRLPVSNTHNRQAHWQAPSRSLTPLRAQAPSRSLTPLRAQAPSRSLTPLRAQAPIRPLTPKADEDPLPAGWEQRLTDDNQIYYAHTSNPEWTTYLRPPIGPLPWPDYFEIRDPRLAELVLDFYTYVGYERSKKVDFGAYWRYEFIEQIDAPDPNLPQPPLVSTLDVNVDRDLRQNIRDFHLTFGFALSMSKDFDAFCKVGRDSSIPYIPVPS